MATIPTVASYTPPAGLHGEHSDPRGWVKSNAMPGIAHPRVRLTFKLGRGAPKEFLSFYVAECQLTRFRTNHRVFVEAPAGSFVFDARHLQEDEGATHARAQYNLKALDHAYGWWRDNKMGPRATFFCYSGHNRSVTSAVFFACSALMELLDGHDNWSVLGAVYRPAPGGEELEISRPYESEYEDFPGFVLSLIWEVRPQAFHDTEEPLRDEIWKLAKRVARMGRVELGEKEERARDEIVTNSVAPAIGRRGKPIVRVKQIDYWALWRGHEENRLVLCIVGSGLRARMQEDWWIGQRWLGKELPPRLRDPRIEEEGHGTKRGAPGEAKQRGVLM